MLVTREAGTANELKLGVDWLALLLLLFDLFKIGVVCDAFSVMPELDSVLMGVEALEIEDIGTGGIKGLAGATDEDEVEAVVEDNKDEEDVVEDEEAAVEEDDVGGAEGANEADEAEEEDESEEVEEKAKEEAEEEE